MMSCIVTKVYDQGCPICETMSRFDQSVFQAFPEVKFQEVLFDDLREFDNNLTKQRIYRCLEQYAVSPTYEIDFPTYVFLTKQGKYMGHLQGAHTIQKFREGVKNILDNNSE